MILLGEKKPDGILGGVVEPERTLFPNEDYCFMTGQPTPPPNVPPPEIRPY